MLVARQHHSVNNYTSNKIISGTYIMLSIPEIASQLVEKSLAQSKENENACTVFIVGSKSVGKSTLIYSFLERQDNPKETLVLEYSFGRKSSQKQSLEKAICHTWEYGGKLDILKSVLPSVPISGQYYYCIVVDLSRIKNIWNILENCIQAIEDSESDVSPEIIIIGGKYDIFKNYDTEIKKFICTTLRSVAVLYNAHLVFYSSKEPVLARKMKDLFYSIGFGNGFVMKDKNTNIGKPLFISKGSDSWDNIGVPASTFEQIKTRHISGIASEAQPVPLDLPGPQKTHPEPILDNILASKYEELRNLDFDVSIDDYLMSLR